MKQKKRRFGYRCTLLITLFIFLLAMNRSDDAYAQNKGEVKPQGTQEKKTPLTDDKAKDKLKKEAPLKAPKKEIPKGLSPKVLLRYTLAKGTRFDYKVSFDQKNEISAKGENQTKKINTGMTFLMKFATVKEIDKNKSNVEMNLKVEKLMVNDMDMSKNLSRHFKDVTFLALMNQRGKILKFVEVKGLKGTVSQEISKLKDTLSQNYPELPRGQVKVGDKWELKKKIPVVLPEAVTLTTDIHFVYKLDSFKQIKGRECAVILIESKLNTSGTSLQGDVRVSISGQGSGNGVMYFDYRRGVLVNISMNVKSINKMSMGFSEIEQKIELTSQLDLLEK